MTRDELKQILSYDPETGVFTWIKSMPPRGRVGQIAGNSNGNGYIRMSVRGKKYYAHRLAFLYMTGENPEVIDHIDGNPLNNKWSNLRNCDQVTNIANQKGKSGVRQRYGRWYARFSNTHLGVFDTEAEAIAARKAAQIKAAGIDPDSFLRSELTFVKRYPYKKFYYQGKNLSEWAKELNMPQPTLWHKVFVQEIPIEKIISRNSTN